MKVTTKMECQTTKTQRKTKHFSRNQTLQTNYFLKKNYFPKAQHFCLFCVFFLYPTSSDIIVNKDQYIFYNHFKVPLIVF